MFSIFDYNDGVFQLNIWGFVLFIFVLLLVASTTILSLSRADRLSRKEK